MLRQEGVTAAAAGPADAMPRPAAAAAVIVIASIRRLMLAIVFTSISLVCASGSRLVGDAQRFAFAAGGNRPLADPVSVVPLTVGKGMRNRRAPERSCR